MLTTLTSLTSYYTNMEKNQFTTLTSLTSSCEQKRKEILDRFRIKQPFRVSVGLSKWMPYESFKPYYNLREILDDEIVIEFDNEDRSLTWKAINLTAINLYQSGYMFQIWDHKGRSPHIHIHNLPIKSIKESSERALWKKIFIKRYVPVEYQKWVDKSLTNIHVIAIEWSNHWKGCHGVKELLFEFNPAVDNLQEKIEKMNFKFEDNLSNIISSNNLEAHNLWIKSITIKPEDLGK